MFILTRDNIHSPSLADLVNNIAASLLSIPLVFLLYDYSNYRISRRVNETLADTMRDKVNSIMLNLIVVLRQMMNVRARLTLENLNKMLTWRPGEISRRLRVTPAHIDALGTIHTDLDNLLYRGGQGNILPGDDIQILAVLARELSHLINENKFRGNKHLTAKYMSNVMSHITDWLDSDAASALHLDDAPSPVAQK